MSTSIAENIIINGHTDSLYILIRNLLDNAIKYTPNSGKIALTLHNNGKLEISDTGSGISDADKQRVFNRFVRVDKSGQTGSGLGLSIVQWIANAHGAAITLRDKKPHGLIVELDFKS